ncbi:WLM domain-containing protein [Citrus sinensis]|uniref:WLM domain-containing protein n=1 Tax=Citrus sinensis TaxID=2711 RepID=A0ACB8N6V5_CITSI|nr:WLM domain-containing protein [Citrus sinensis]
MQDLGSMLKVSAIWRGKKYVVEVNSGSSLKELGHELQKLTDVKADTMRFIVPQNKGSKLLSPFSDEHSSLSLQEVSIIEGKSMRMMGVSEDEVDKVLQNEKADLRIAGFDEEEKRLRQRMLDRTNAPLKLPQGQYIFCDFRTLQIPGVELNPPASEALKIMHMLAADPGIIAIMNKHRWRVGIMTELAPVGYVGVSPKCVLGFNKNHGEEISLRLRTDDLKGFRKYESIKKTLLHELAHMVYSEHDANFYGLDKQLNQEAVALDWTKSRGHTLSGVRHTSHHEDDLFVGDSRSFSQKLGGNISDQLASARASSVAAAYRRLANASANSLGVSEVHEEPDPDDSGLIMLGESHHTVSAAKGSLDIESPSRDQWKGHEPDPDDDSGYENKLEPDPDDSQDGEPLEPENYSDPEMVQQVSPKKLAATNPYEEPDPDDSETAWKSGVVVEPESLCSQLMEVDDTVQLRRTSAEPDPDDSEAELKIKIVNDTTEDQGHLYKAQREPDPDELLANEVVQQEPDPDDNLVQLQEISSMKIDEPDPDDQELRSIQDTVTVVCSRLQKAIEMLRAEVSPLESTTVLQTLFKIIRNVIEHPDETKYKRLRKANPIIQRSVANYKAAMEILFLVGFNEDVVLDEIGKAETYLVLKRNDLALLWLAKSSLETCIAY